MPNSINFSLNFHDLGEINPSNSSEFFAEQFEYIWNLIKHDQYDHDLHPVEASENYTT